MHLEDFNAHRPLLFGIAYRMLGRVTETEDILQEAWLKWHRQDLTQVQNAKAWLVAAVTRLCIDHLRGAAHQREHYYGVWLPEPYVEGSAPSPPDFAHMTDSLTMAFMLLLDALSPSERAVFLLREVFDYDYPDIAAILGKSEANCRQIVRRAKQQLHPAASGREAAPSDQAERVVQEFLDATSTGDVQRLLSLLTSDATLYSDGGGKVRAAGRPIHTADRVSRFFAGISRWLPPDTRVQVTRINGRPGALMSAGGRVYNAISFDLTAERLRAIYVVRNPEKLRHLDGMI